MAPLCGLEADEVVELPKPAKSVPEATAPPVLEAVAAAVLVAVVRFTRLGS